MTDYLKRLLDTGEYVAGDERALLVEVSVEMKRMYEALSTILHDWKPRSPSRRWKRKKRCDPASEAYYGLTGWKK